MKQNNKKRPASRHSVEMRRGPNVGAWWQVTKSLYFDRAVPTQRKSRTTKVCFIFPSSPKEQLEKCQYDFFSRCTSVTSSLCKHKMTLSVHKTGDTEQLAILWKRGKYSATIHRGFKKNNCFSIYTRSDLNNTRPQNVQNKIIQSRFSSHLETRVTPAILILLDHALFTPKRVNNYSEIANQSDCLNHQDHWVNVY